MLLAVMLFSLAVMVATTLLLGPWVGMLVGLVIMGTAILWELRRTLGAGSK